MSKSESLSKTIKLNVDQLLKVYAERDAEHNVKVTKFEEECLATIKSIQAEKDAWSAEKEKIAHTQTFSPNIKLDVGGIHFTTSLTTLRRFPDTMIGVMFSGRHALPKNEDGYFFIDRDGTHFRHILNFLRNPDDFEVELSPAHTEELRREVRYYGLEELMFPKSNFVKAAEKQVQTISGCAMTVGQTDEGIWYVKPHNHFHGLNKKQQIPLTMCIKCRVAYETVTRSGDYFHEFTSTRPVVSKNQPKPSASNPCIACYSF